jgi:SnoaL-like domain
MTPLEAEIDALLARYYERFGAMDFDGARATWDTSDPQPTYLAEEIDDFLRDWRAIEGYWAASQAAMSRLASRHWEVRARQLTDELATATWRLHWNAQVIGQDRPVGGDVRVTGVFRRLAGGWRLFHYVEAPLAPIIYVRKLYQGQVDADFLASLPPAGPSG